MRCFLFFFLAVSYFSASAQNSIGPTNTGIDRSDLRTLVSVLTSDSLEGRAPGTMGHQRTERFISDRLQYLGLTPFKDDTYLESFELMRSWWDRVYVRSKGKILMNFADVVFRGSIPVNEEVDADLIFGGTGTTEELGQIEVKDRWVLIFSRNLRAHFDIAAALRKRHAAGVILANPDDDRQFESIRTTLMDHGLQKRLYFPGRDTVSATWDTIRSINVFLLPNRQIKTLMGFSANQLREAISGNSIDKIPLSRFSFRCERRTEKIKVSNVIGVVKGRTKKTIVVTAHYDHLGRGEGYFAGADDNASGVAGMLELAERFLGLHDLEYNIMFVATTAEEAGLLGSWYHVNRSDFEPADIVCNVNLDMIGRGDKKHGNQKYLYCMGTRPGTRLDSLVRKADELINPCSVDFDLNTDDGLYARSDQYSFHQRGIPAILFFSGLHEDYHKTTDTMDKIDFRNLENRVWLVAMLIELMEREGLGK